MMVTNAIRKVTRASLKKTRIRSIQCSSIRKKHFSSISQNNSDITGGSRINIPSHDVNGEPIPSVSSLRRNRPMVHLSSAPNEKFTGKKIGSSHPIVPYPTTPQRRIVPRNDNASGINSLSRPSYAFDGVVDSPDFTNDDVTIHNSVTIDKIRKASQLAAKMLHEACDLAQQEPFMSTDDIDRIIHCSILNHKVSIDDSDDTIHAYPSPLNYNHFPKSICCSVNEVICHGIPDLRALQDGDLLSIDVSVFLNGVHGDNCASIIIGEDNNNSDNDEVLEQKERAKILIQATEEAMYAAIEVCHHGTPLNEIGNAVHDIAESYGFRPVKNVCGHGIGQQLHMNPQIKVSNPFEDMILREKIESKILIE